MYRLDGKKVLITGASRGLGRQLALDFARAGAAQLALIARGREDLEEAADAVKQAAPGSSTLQIVADLTDQTDVERVVGETLAEFNGELHVLVNNAAVIGPTPLPLLLDYPPDEFDRVLRTNLTAPFLMIQRFLPALLAARGSIINVTSDAGIVGYAGWGAYGISKFGLEGLSQTWAAELEGTGVRLNWVDPGEMNTDMHRAALPDADPSEYPSPQALTDVFLYLASDESRGVHGRRLQAQEFEATENHEHAHSR